MQNEAIFSYLTNFKDITLYILFKDKALTTKEEVIAIAIEGTRLACWLDNPEYIDRPSIKCPLLLGPDRQTKLRKLYDYEKQLSTILVQVNLLPLEIEQELNFFNAIRGHYWSPVGLVLALKEYRDTQKENEGIAIRNRNRSLIIESLKSMREVLLVLECINKIEKEQARPSQSREIPRLGLFSEIVRNLIRWEREKNSWSIPGRRALIEFQAALSQIQGDAMLTFLVNLKGEHEPLQTTNDQNRLELEEQLLSELESIGSKEVSWYVDPYTRNGSNTRYIHRMQSSSIVEDSDQESISPAYPSALPRSIRYPLRIPEDVAGTQARLTEIIRLLFTDRFSEAEKRIPHVGDLQDPYYRSNRFVPPTQETNQSPIQQETGSRFRNERDDRGIDRSLSGLTSPPPYIAGNHQIINYPM